MIYWVRTISEVSVMKGELRWLSLITFLMWILIEVINPGCIERRSASFDPMNEVALLKKQLSQVAAILTGNACYQCDFR